VRRLLLVPGLLIAQAPLVVAVGTVQAQAGTVPLFAGCNNVAMPYPAGTPVLTAISGIQPQSAIRGVFHYDAITGSFAGFSPSAPDAVNDYLLVGALLEPVYICMDAPGTFAGPPLQPAAPAAPAAVQRGVISAPARAARGTTVQIVIGATPNIACTGGVNIPNGGTYRTVDIAQGTSPSGVLAVQFDLLPDDWTGIATFHVRCADFQEIRFEFEVT
jgi:hypothetical protein